MFLGLALRLDTSPGSGFLRDMERLGATDAWDFVGQSYLRAGVVGPSGITFTRASAGYAETTAGTLVEFASGAPRITDRGLLIEESRQNLVVESQVFSVAAWAVGIANPCPVANNVASAPDNTTTADRLTVAASTPVLRQIFSGLTIGATYTATIFVRAPISGAATHFRLTSNNTVAWGTGGSTKIALTSTWQRVTITWTQTATTQAYLVLGSLTAGGVADADCYGDVLAWGAQLEAATFATSYIKTAGTAVTRAADAATIENFSISGAHSLLAFKGASSAAANETLIQLDGGTTDNRSLLYLNATGRIRVDSGGGNQADQSIGSWAGTAQRYAARIVTNDVRGALNGALGAADTAATLPAGTLTTCRIGQNAAGNALNGYLERAALFPLALTDAQLQGITT